MLLPGIIYQVYNTSINFESPSLTPLAQYDQELGEAIELEYLRFMPFMNKALARLVQEEHPQYANDADDQVSYETLLLLS